jgi:hypothetical protein
MMSRTVPITKVEIPCPSMPFARRPTVSWQYGQKGTSNARSTFSFFSSTARPGASSLSTPWWSRVPPTNEKWVDATLPITPRCASAISAALGKTISGSSRGVRPRGDL